MPVDQSKLEVSKPEPPKAKAAPDLAAAMSRIETLEQQMQTLKNALKDFYDVEGKGSVG